MATTFVIGGDGTAKISSAGEFKEFKAKIAAETSIDAKTQQAIIDRMKGRSMAQVQANANQAEAFLNPTAVIARRLDAELEAAKAAQKAVETYIKSAIAKGIPPDVVEANAEHLRSALSISGNLEAEMVAPSRVAQSAWSSAGAKGKARALTKGGRKK